MIKKQIKRCAGHHRYVAADQDMYCKKCLDHAVNEELWKMVRIYDNQILWMKVWYYSMFAVCTFVGMVIGLFLI